MFGRLFTALAHAHDRGVVHRDLKPANVLLGAEGAQLADFGIAHLEAELLTGPMVTRLTETAAVLGTLPYMSPEQRRGGAVDRRSDLFSAGVMLYEAATGVLPQGAFAPPSRMNPMYGRGFDRIATQLLQADPARRPPSAASVGAALAATLLPGRRRPLALAASVGAMVLTLVGGTLGIRAMFRPDGKAETKALADVAPEPPKPAPVTETPAAAPSPGEGLSKLLGTGADEKQRSRGKIKRKVVLKAVSDVKKLRADVSKSPTAKPAPAKSAKPGKKTAKSEEMSAPEPPRK